MIRRSFSLIEIMVVIVLVGTIASVSIFSLWPFYQSFRFRLEVDSLYELLQELQIEAMTLQSDMQVCFTNEKGKWKAESKSDEPILKPQVIDLSHVEYLSPVSDITLYSCGLVEPRNILKLSRKNDHRWIDLSGGHLIVLCEKEPHPFKSEKKLDLEEIKKQLLK